MKKLNLLLFVFIALLLGACESETENQLIQPNGQSRMTGGAHTDIQTRAGISLVPYWAVGEKVGVFMSTDNNLKGPLDFTISKITNVIEFAEPIPFFDNYSLHTFYAYHPYQASQSTDPRRVNVTPVNKIQEQIGNTTQHLSDYEYNIAIPTSIYSDEDLFLYFASTYTVLDFQVTTNANDLIIKSIHVEAPQGQPLNFTGATTDITLSLNDPGFAQYSNLQGTTSETLLNISGGLSVPHTTDHASAYMVINPFNGTNQTLKVTVTTEDDKEYPFEVAAQNYRFGSTYVIPLHIQVDRPQPVIKDIRVLSLCDVGCLGTKDNTKKWDCHYGALNLTAKEIRRLLFEHFGKGKTVETGIISFEKTDINCKLNKLTEAYLDQFNIIYLNKNGRPDIQTAQRIMNWLNKSPDRVLMLSYDWKDACLTPDMKESKILCTTATNYLMFRDQISEIKPHWYNASKINQPIGNWGTTRSGLLVPFELNDRTSYFWKDGPFKTDLNEASDQRFWIKDCYWGSAEITDPDVIPLITYKDARDYCNPAKQHKNGYGDGGMILGVNPTSRIVYIGDSEIFSTSCVVKKVEDARMAKEESCKKTGELNDYSKIMGNLWAWMIQEIIQRN